MELNLFKYINTLVFGFSVTFILISCEEKIDWEIKSEAIEAIVVDGIITNEAKIQVIKLSFPVQEYNTIPQHVTGAKVFIGTNDSVYNLIETDSGKYITPDVFQATVGKEYLLNIEYNDIVITAVSNIIPVSPIFPLSYYLNETDSLYRITWINEKYGDENAMYEVLLDWSHLAGYDTLDTLETMKMAYSYSFTTIDVNEIFSAPSENVAFPPGTIITERKYSLTEGHAQYLRGLLMETEWKGWIFDAQPANVQTNLSSGGLGYFALCSVAEYQFVAD